MANINKFASFFTLNKHTPSTQERNGNITSFDDACHYGYYSYATIICGKREPTFLQLLQEFMSKLGKFGRERVDKTILDRCYCTISISQTHVSWLPSSGNYLQEKLFAYLINTQHFETDIQHACFYVT